MSRLTERKKADREQMAKLVEALCAEHGVKCERSIYHGPREIVLGLELEGLRVGVDFDGDNPRQLLDNYCLAWHTRNRRLSSLFGRVMRAEVNPFHRRKCTTFAAGIDALLALLSSGFEMAKDGRAFEDLAA